MKNGPVILIGPMATGKTTVAQALAKATGIPNVPMDRVRWYSYFVDGYSLERELELLTLTEKMAYWKPFELKAVRRVLREFPRAIVDFGAGHSYYTDSAQFREAAELLAPLPNIFLLLPTPDRKKSLEICNARLLERKKAPLDADDIEANRNFITHESNYALAKHTVYTDGKKPEAIAREIAERLVR